jgi:hypothetical protein
MIAIVLLRRLYQARLAAVRKRGDDPNFDGDIIDFPLFSLFEDGQIRASDREGSLIGYHANNHLQGPEVRTRSRYQQSVALENRPGYPFTVWDTGHDENQNPADQKAIGSSVEAAGEDVDELPGLTLGQTVVSGDAMNTPVHIQLRQRHTQHSADSIPATQRLRNANERRYEQPTRFESTKMGGGDSTCDVDLLGDG